MLKRNSILIAASRSRHPCRRGESRPTSSPYRTATRLYCVHRDHDKVPARYAADAVTVRGHPARSRTRAHGGRPVLARGGLAA